MRLAAAALSALAALTLAACGEIPQPFRHDDDGVPRLARPKMTRGVTVHPPADTAEGRSLADALVRALEDQEVPALVRDGTAFGHVIDGQVRDDGKTVSVHWVLKAPDGSTAAESAHTVTRAVLDQNNPVLMKRAAVNAATTLAAPLADPDALPVKGPAVAVADNRPSVTVVPLRGLPGDGDKSLTEALKRALGRGGLLVKDDGADYMVEGMVTVAPGLPGEDTVTVAWRVKRGSGAELGNIAQDGGVPRGRLSQAWGTMARDIAEGGAAGVVEVVLSDTAGERTKRRLP
ncbi:MAG: hypothetical protein ACM31D_20480 [Bacteroidota bacterium]